MKRTCPILILLSCSLFLSAFPVFAQDNKKDENRKKEKKVKVDRDKKDKDERDNKKENDWDKKEREDKDDRKGNDRDKNDREDKNDDREKKDREYNENKDHNDDRNDRPTARKKTGILGRVLFPGAGTDAPRRLEGVPKGHYPPPGSCRIWYPNRSPGQQPPPADCGSLSGVALEPGAFILHGDRAYDAEYDWKKEETRRPGTVDRDILDILFPRRQR